ncbi:MAG TPA: STAS domain-containing protein [Gemmatimonadota bacterium]|nr:STAS domain-containing protein [Gemmatimonadota bacterium]
MTVPPVEPLLIEPRSAPAGGAVVLEVTGDLLVSNMSALEAAVDQALDAGALRLVLDLTAIGHVDTPGLALLYRLHRRCEGAGGALVVAGLPDRFADLVRKLRLEDRMAFADGIQEAERRLAR